MLAFRQSNLWYEKLAQKCCLEGSTASCQETMPLTPLSFLGSQNE